MKTVVYSLTKEDILNAIEEVASDEMSEEQKQDLIDRISGQGMDLLDEFFCGIVNEAVREIDIKKGGQLNV